MEGGENMKPMKPLYVVIIVVIVAAAGFYGGMQYEKSKTASFASNAVGGAGGRFGGQGGFGGAGRGGNGANRPVSGQIVSQDANSITVKMTDGSSKIINYSGQTKINKASSGAASDLKSGTQVSVFGTTNSDGSVTAQIISIGNGNMMFRGGGGGKQSAPTQGQ